MLARWAQFCKDCYIISTCTPSCPATGGQHGCGGLAQDGAWLCYPLRWLSIYNKECDITVIQPISSTSTSELFRKALVYISMDVYLIKFQFLAIFCVFCVPFTWRILHHRCTILSILIWFKTTRPRAYLLPPWKLLFGYREDGLIWPQVIRECCFWLNFDFKVKSDI